MQNDSDEKPSRDRMPESTIESRNLAGSLVIKWWESQEENYADNPKKDRYWQSVCCQIGRRGSCELLI